MSRERSTISRYQPSDQQLRYAAGAIALLIAGFHMFHPKHGLQRLVLMLTIDPGLIVNHPRPLAFVLSSIAIIIGVQLVIFDISKRPVYALGILLMLTYLVGYSAWHYTGHGGFLPGRESYGHVEIGPLENVIIHLKSDAWARATKIFESILLALLVILYRQES